MDGHLRPNGRATKEWSALRGFRAPGLYGLAAPVVEASGTETPGLEASKHPGPKGVKAAWIPYPHHTHSASSRPNSLGEADHMRNKQDD